MARFLSDDWIDQVGQAAAASDTLATATVGMHLSVQQVVTDGPEGDVRYVVAIDDGGVALQAGTTETPDVTFTLDWDSAVALATGRLSSQEAFTTGRLKVRGDVGGLLAAGPALAGLQGIFADVRDATTY